MEGVKVGVRLILKFLVSYDSLKTSRLARSVLHNVQHLLGGLGSRGEEEHRTLDGLAFPDRNTHGQSLLYSESISYEFISSSS